MVQAAAHENFTTHLVRQFQFLTTFKKLNVIVAFSPVSPDLLSLLLIFLSKLLR